MAKHNIQEYREEAPVTLDNHPFYGLQLDEEQKAFRDAIWDEKKLIVFANAAAGTGKTTIAAATANLLVQYGRYKGIVYIASPTQEQKQGYLAGSLQEKSEPYFEPFYQALNKIGVNLMTCMTSDMINMKNGTGYIQCITHTFLRGCNFENMVVLCDESQNYTIDEMRKVLTRVHSENCKVIVIGHSEQCDIVCNKDLSGFSIYLDYFKSANDDRVGICSLTKNYRGWISSYADNIYTYIRRKKSIEKSKD